MQQILVFLGPDPADLREGCQFLPTPPIQTHAQGVLNLPVWASPPSRGPSTRSSKQQAAEL
eukprot:3517371-Pyramimonas_sp.AAC.1